MIVWINGLFGAGKSTLAAGLNTALPGSVIPEDIGTLLRQSMAGYHRQQRDHQDYPAWRHLTVRLVAELHQLTAGPVIIPMTTSTRSTPASSMHRCPSSAPASTT
ncbi:AAA family ATPase [Streptomyces sp. NC-S4]